MRVFFFSRDNVISFDFVKHLMNLFNDKGRSGILLNSCSAVMNRNIIEAVFQSSIIKFNFFLSN